MSERRQDFELLQRFTRGGDQSAFADVVRRHLDLVYGTAWRKVELPEAAQEVAQNVFGVVTSLGHNLVSASAGSSGWTNSDLLGVAPLLLPLGNYGGPTRTLLPQPSSPTVESGDDAVLAAPWSLTTDQRGGVRRAGAHVDIGAVELAGLLGVPDVQNVGTAFAISFTTEPGWSRHLESKDALAPTVPWAPVPGTTVAGNGGVMTVQDGRGRSTTNRFYRVVMTP